MRTIASGAALAAIFLPLLSACGGGGSGNPPDVSDGGPPPVTFTVEEAQAAVSRRVLEAAQRAGAGTPGFGSVTQSTNQDGSGVTTDRARATFVSGPRLVVDVARRSGGALSLDTAHHTIDYEIGTSSITGRSFGSAAMLKHSASEFTLARVATDWASDDATDYLAGGYWLHATGDIYNGRVTAAEMGAFVDGPELRDPPSLPITGTATYNGLAAGLYAARYGSDVPDVPRGTNEIGEFEGNLRMVANFGAGNISGAVNDIYLSYIGETPGGVAYSGQNERSDYRLNLGTAQIDSNGTFTGNDATLTHPLLSISSTGSWGGRFSTTDDSAGNPRLVAGTLGGSGTTSGGSIASFVGAFYGATPQFD